MKITITHFSLFMISIIIFFIVLSVNCTPPPPPPLFRDQSSLSSRPPPFWLQICVICWLAISIYVYTDYTLHAGCWRALLTRPTSFLLLFNIFQSSCYFLFKNVNHEIIAKVGTKISIFVLSIVICCYQLLLVFFDVILTKISVVNVKQTLI